MKEIISVFLFIALFSVLSCKEDKPTPYENSCTGCHSVLEAKKFFAFKVGSWWVYEEETSGERDSLYVYESSIDPDSYQFNIRIRSALTDYEYHYWPFFAGGNNSCSEEAPVKMKCLYVVRSKGKPGDYIGEDNCFFVNYSVGDDAAAYNNQHIQNNKIIVDEVLTNYPLMQYNFQETVKIHELNTMVEGYQPTNHYFSKNVGLIRKELLDSNEVWNLVNYYIAP